MSVTTLDQPVRFDRSDWSYRSAGPDLGAGDWVSAEPFRALLRHVIAVTGLPWRVVAGLAGAVPREVYGLLQGRDGRPVRKIRRSLAQRLYALTPDVVAAARQTPVPVEQAALGLQTLLASGWTLTELSSRTRLSGRLLRAIDEGSRPLCSRLVEVQILAALEALEDIRVPSSCSTMMPTTDLADGSDLVGDGPLDRAA